MSIIGSPPPSRGNLLVLFLTGALIAIVAFGSRWFFGPGELTQHSAASYEQAFPQQPGPSDQQATSSASVIASSVSQGARRPGEAPANPDFLDPEIDNKPAGPDLDLIEASPDGPLPRIGNEGKRALEAYARPYRSTEDRPQIAIVITGLGAQTDATNAAFHLPAMMSLSFSPYAEELPSLFERARLAGHEVLLELPMEPVDYPTNDPGPHTLRASDTSDVNVERLNWILSRAPGYFALAGASGSFGDSPEATAIMETIAAKGLGLIEINGGKLEVEAQQADLAYASTQQWVDLVPSAEAIDNALANLEARARIDGTVIGVAEAYPITLQRLVNWSNELNSRGISLVPVSKILIEKHGRVRGDGSIPGSDVAQSQN